MDKFVPLSEKRVEFWRCPNADVVKWSDVVEAVEVLKQKIDDYHHAEAEFHPLKEYNRYVKSVIVEVFGK